MESKVYEVALMGNETYLHELLEKDASILDRCAEVGVEGNPLHIAALYGHTCFAREILSRKPEFASQLNSKGYLPLHLASAKGNIEMVKDLLQVDPETCLVRDPEGSIPLHSAVIKGRVEILEELVRAKPVTTRVLTDGGESILHLCLKQKRNRFECIKKLVELVDVKERDEFVKLKDNDDNTLLHLSTAMRQSQIIEFLLAGETRVDVNALNVNGFTALDVLLDSSNKSGVDTRIKRRLRSAGAKRSKDINPKFPQYGCFGGNKRKKQLKKEDDRFKDAGNTLMVVAILIATVTYQSGLSPPGGVMQGEFEKTATDTGTLSVNSGVAVLGIKEKIAYSYFIICNTISFAASLAIILLLISGFPIRTRVSRITLVVLLWVAITSMLATYLEGVMITSSLAIKYTFIVNMRGTLLLSLGVMGVLLVGPFVRLVGRLLRKLGIIREKEECRPMDDRHVSPGPDVC
ncbi:uncharacterized protein LOC143879300 [Tasmannia lanceolata]|uniref:uncharacterized protein LOC143879300 n=1 Tax=Tasmannia lanceolata TaxID=3420 RepID=UPI004062E1D1